ncbi:hypothetical protein TTHERM_00571570 (macronuclear) [Tetrahymena thermophila SB210]|uniref:Importin N-terminal domain-containing protein n=1 Tax=Tetrahymena thermophila (strain SB210) TaxID=312017 RepID=Q24I17_TETTS|nr:hypothetical protein TTHERM_00571570 [Tetrahymena thermophila SB210]EAS07421.1 hypothetical protein TTHERM_00571570 [Tetrahymena thermophila SB210]|eukprot:XP_001027663.1 hypothetical protein TTHERM_00571570 [Tetrahymena thermophila SB210]
MDQAILLKVREALQLSMMSTDKSVRDESTQFLKQMNLNQQFFLMLFEIINNKEYGETQNLQAAIYITKFIQTEYVNLEGTFKFDLQDAMLQSFLNHSISKVRNQLRVGIMRLIITDFPKSKILELLIQALSKEKLLQMSSEQITTITTLYYFVFKALYQDKQHDHKLKSYVVNYFNQKRDLFVAIIAASVEKLKLFAASYQNGIANIDQAMNELNNQVSISCLRYAIKFLNIENLLSINNQAQLSELVNQVQVVQQITLSFSSFVNLHESVDQQEKLFDFIHSLRQVIYSYHKYFIGAVQEKRTTANKSIAVLEYFKGTYFVNSQNLILNNESFISSQQLNDSSLLNKLNSQPKLVQFFEDECNLITQSLNFCSELIQVLGFRSTQHLFYGDQKSLEENCEDEVVICQYFDQHYFQIIIEFLLKKVLKLNWSQLAMINLEPERAFSEDKGSDMTGIRKAGVNLLIVFMQSVNEEKMLELINQLLIQFTSSICTGKQAYSEMLEREAFYFIMNGLYKDIKNTIEFEDWYVSVLSTELIIDDDNLIPLKVQILNLIYSYLSNSYQIPEETALSLFQTIASLMIDSNQSIYIRLMSMKCFIPLMDNCIDLMVNIDQIMGGIRELFNQCEESESKMLLLEFVQNLIDLIKDTSPEFMTPVFQFLYKEWQQACDNEDSQQLSLKAQITKVLSSILIKQGLDITQIQFITEVINYGTQTDELQEIYLIENACRLMYFFTKELNKKLSEDYPTSMMNILKLKPADIYTPYEQAIREREMLIKEAAILEKVFLNFVQRIESIFLNKQSLYNTSILILIELINSPFESVAQSIGNTLQKGIIDNLNEIKDELFCYIFDALEYLQIVYPLSTAQVVEQITLNLISESINKGLFNNQMKLYVLRIIGRAFFNNISVGTSLCEKIASAFQEPDFLNNLLFETAKILEQIKPDLYFYRMQYSCMLSVIQILLKVSNAEGKAHSITDLKIRSLIDTYVQELEKVLQVIKQSYDKSISQDEHWILVNLRQLLKNEEIFDPQEVNIDRANQITKNLNQDKLRKIDFAPHTKLFFTQNNIIPSIEIDFDKLSLEC